MSTYILIFAILIPGLYGRTINFDPNLIDKDIDKNIMYKNTPITCSENESVQLVNMSLKEVRTGLIKSTAIKSLSLEGNLITKVPENIFKDIPNLQCLNLAHNKIPFERILRFRHDTLNSLIVSHQQESNDLEQLDMWDGSNNNLVLDTSMSYFPQLENLHLDNVYFEYFNFFNQSFPRLKSLYLMENGLRYVKLDILSILPYNLKNLHLERNNIEHLEFDDTANLEGLYLDGNPFSTLNIGFLRSNLRMLSLSKCNLDSFGQNMLQSNLSLLTALDLSHNIISLITMNTFERTPFLETLSLSHNALSEFPFLQYLQKLKSLSLSYNSIEDITSVIRPSSLRRLSLRHNRIRSINSMAFSELEFLEELDLSENRLTSLPADWSINLKNLQYLNLKSNQFARIMDMGISPLLNLRELYIKYNLVKTIDQNSLQLVPNQCTVYVT